MACRRSSQGSHPASQHAYRVCCKGCSACTSHQLPAHAGAPSWAGRYRSPTLGQQSVQGSPPPQKGCAYTPYLLASPAGTHALPFTWHPEKSLTMIRPESRTPWTISAFMKARPHTTTCKHGRTAC